MRIDLYTDGSAKGNPGPGGYGVVLQAFDEDGNLLKEKELSEGFKNTTNNRMELLAAIVGLEALTQPTQVTLYSDSQYLVKAINEHWLDGWVKRGWKKPDKKPVKNADLWQRLLPLLQLHTVTFIWVKGHAGHPANERCDTLATTAADGNNLHEDTGFLSTLF